MGSNNGGGQADGWSGISADRLGNYIDVGSLVSSNLMLGLHGLEGIGYDYNALGFEGQYPLNRSLKHSLVAGDGYKLLGPSDT